MGNWPIRRKTIQIRIEEGLHERVKKYAMERGLTVSELITIALTEYMDQKRAINVIEDLLKKLKEEEKEGGQ